MRFVITFLSIFVCLSCTRAKEKIFTGSTPAGAVVRGFLGISLSDSIDFIRWKLILNDDQYQLSCNYGIGQPNTNGFVNSGTKIELTGPFKKVNHLYQLHNGNKSLSVAELNQDLLHVVDETKSLLLGNDGWSYTLNNIKPIHSDQANLTPARIAFTDSVSFLGRTPCGVPGVIAPGRECYKLKWYIVLYSNDQKNGSGQYKIIGTPWRTEGGKTSSWKIVTGKDGRIIYQLNDEKGKGFLHLLQLDDKILLFTDQDGKLLVGDEDFSYTINKGTLR